MGLFRASSPVAVRSSAADPVRVQPAGKPASLWQDGFGSLAIRSLQIILVVAVAAGLIIGLRELTVVVIPLLLALILACAFAPVMAWLRRRGVPPLGATLLVLLVVVTILAGIGWLIVAAVRGQNYPLVMMIALLSVTAMLVASFLVDLLTALLDWLDLPFEQACLDFHKSGRAVRTASSEQVRRPINRDGVGQWRAMEPWLDPLIDALGPVLERYPVRLRGDVAILS